MSHSHADRPDIPRLPDAATGQQPAVAGRRGRQLPQYNVVLHKSDNELMFVVRSVMELTRFPRAEATHKMWESVHRGRSVLVTTYLERAEFLVEQFATKRLRVTAEPV